MNQSTASRYFITVSLKQAGACLSLTEYEVTIFIPVRYDPHLDNNVNIVIIYDADTLPANFHLHPIRIVGEAEEEGAAEGIPGAVGGRFTVYQYA